MKKIKKEQLKLNLAEFIGQIIGNTVTINGKPKQVIIDASSLINFLREIIIKLD